MEKLRVQHKLLEDTHIRSQPLCLIAIPKSTNFFPRDTIDYSYPLASDVSF